MTVKYVTKPTDELPCLRKVYCEIDISQWSQNVTKLGNSSVLLKCADCFWVISKLSKNNIMGNMPTGDHCGRDNDRRYYSKRFFLTLEYYDATRRTLPATDDIHLKNPNHGLA